MSSVAKLCARVSFSGPVLVGQNPVSLALNFLSYAGFGIAALVISQTADPTDVATCDPAVTNYTGILLGIGITEVVMAALTLLVLPVVARSRGDPTEMSNGGRGLVNLHATVTSMGGVAVFVLFIVGSVRTWQPGWASLSCLATPFWYRLHQYFLAAWITSGAVCALACLIACVAGVAVASGAGAH